jgi:ABC-2 type transport system ATP-binding protein/lipopolysaccharide transport system ATP-binding protein
MKDQKNREKYIYNPDESLTIEFDVKAAKPQTDFVFGIGIFNTEGIMCYGSNTFLEDFTSKRISGDGKVSVEIPGLNLINGTYFLDIAVHKRDGYPFDYHHFQYSFKVTSTNRDLGIARVPHQWDFSSNIQLKKK